MSRRRGRDASLKKMRHVNKLGHRREQKRKELDIVNEFAGMFSESQLRRNYMWYYYLPAYKAIQGQDEITKEDKQMLKNLISNIPNGYGALDDLEDDDDFVYTDEE